MDFGRFLKQIRSDYNYAGQVAHVEQIESREAHFAALDDPLDPSIQDALTAEGIEQFYTHQAQAINAARRGENVVVVTSTASGKTLCYQVPTLESLISTQEATALYLFPTKASPRIRREGLLVLGNIATSWQRCRARMMATRHPTCAASFAKKVA